MTKYYPFDLYTSTNSNLEGLYKNIKKKKPVKYYPRTPEEDKLRPAASTTTASPLMQRLMKAKEIDTKLVEKKKRKEKDGEYFALLEEFQTNSKNIEIESTTPTKRFNNDSHKRRS